MLRSLLSWTMTSWGVQPRTHTRCARRGEEGEEGGVGEWGNGEGREEGGGEEKGGGGGGRGRREEEECEKERNYSHNLLGGRDKGSRGEVREREEGKEREGGS